MRSLDRPSKPILIVGAGGIGAPLAWALAEAGAGPLCFVDEDAVELGNLHRQVFFDDADVGRSKVLALTDALRQAYPTLEVSFVEGRALPDNVDALVREACVVVDATDNFPTRFLLADAAHLARVPIVHAAAVRWVATVFAASAEGGPCYRCLFEDVPRGVTIDCATAGVAGPVCAVSGALAADRVLRVLDGDRSAFGAIVTFDGEADRLREVDVFTRPACELCGAAPTIVAIDEARYLSGEGCEG